ncbi:MAG: hypothetical protein EZS28_022006 [Streblomastix strix]|uniref:Uncharacterized protein n=1 Tax=Streblomastix strix TaxID=222440 RepID=A0A5J4VJA8_9EUKA|nr:MAG: hypothetical protein EZS28_022006 [Streblomastix strix]
MSEFVTLRRIGQIRFKALADNHFLRGYNFEDTYAEMSITYADICPEKNTLPRIYGLAGKILPYIMDDRSISLTRLQNLHGYFRKAIKFAIENDLKMHQLSQRWILHQLSEHNLYKRIEACGELAHFLGAHKKLDISEL